MGRVIGFRESAVGANRLVQAAGQVVSSRSRILALVVIGVGVSALYSLLLPFSYTQRFGLANLSYLNPVLALWSVLLGFGFGFLLMIQIHAMRAVSAGRPVRGGGLAAVISLLPSFLCCTPIVPTLLTFVGLSGASLYSTTGSVQHFFATEQNPLLLASLLLIVAVCGWSLHRLAQSTCLQEAGCERCDPVPAPALHAGPGGATAAGHRESGEGLV